MKRKKVQGRRDEEGWCVKEEEINRQKWAAKWSKVNLRWHKQLRLTLQINSWDTSTPKLCKTWFNTALLSMSKISILSALVLMFTLLSAKLGHECLLPIIHNVWHTMCVRRITWEAGHTKPCWGLGEEDLLKNKGFQDGSEWKHHL